MTVQFRRRPVETPAILAPQVETHRQLTGFADQQLSLLPPPAWVPASSSAAPDVPAHPPSAPGRLARLLRCGVKRLYLLVRPLVRPLAWRARGFLVADVLPQLARLRESQIEQSSTMAALANRQHQIQEAMRAGPLPCVNAQPPPPLAGSPGRARQRLRRVHQFHAGSASGDAITNAMLMIRARLRALGYHSEIYVEHLAEGLEAELLPLDTLPHSDDHVLLVHHSMGHDRFADVVASPAPKVLIYHNITPPELLTHDPALRQAARLGRVQLQQWRQQVGCAIADSVCNGQELRRLGFTDVREASLLFDVDALLARAAAAPARIDTCFTVLFVGRIVPSKGQAALVDAFARFLPAFQRAYARPARLVLAGAHAGENDRALAEIRGRIAVHGLSEQVIVTGKLSDDALVGWYAQADLYVSLSRHEGFGVPLIEAMAHGVPVLALATAAVPYTIGQHGVLLEDDDPDRVAAAMLDAAGAGKASRSRAEALDRMRLERHWPVLEQALAQAGAAFPPQEATRQALAAGQRIVITGQINGSYSLAAVNRRMALALEAALPGQVRLQPVENDLPATVTDVPRGEIPVLSALAARPPALSGPVVALSQHYPLLVPDFVADMAVTMLFWEETLLPLTMVRRLNASFAAVLAPSMSVARALADSGVRVPIRHVGFAPDLAGFTALCEARALRPAPSPGGVINFLHVSSCFPRKGVDILLSAWARAFRMGDRVRLVIKGFPNPHNDVAAQIDALREADPGAAEIVFVNRDLSQDALLALYADADVMVLPSRGEGFNIPAAEALSAGLRLIVTGFGGHMDFCTAPPHRAQTRLLNYRLAQSASHVAARHALWAEPDADDLVRALREAAGLGRCIAAPTPVLPVPGLIEAADWAGRIGAANADLLLAEHASRPSRVWVTPWRQACGVAEYSRHLLGAFPDDSRQPVVLCDERPPLSGPVHGTLPPGRAAFRFGDSASVPELALAIASTDADVVVLQHQPGLLPWDGLARLLESPLMRRRCLVIALHNTRNLLHAEPALRDRVASLLARARRVLVHALDDLAVLQDLGVTNTTWLPHGTTGGPAPQPPRDMGDAPVIGTTGFFLPHKGIAQLIAAVALLRVDWPGLTLQLVCARYPDPISDQEIERCRTLARALDIDDALVWHTRFLPNETRLELLSGCDLVVMPYAPTEESASGAVRQALASGAPTLVSDLPVFADLGDAVERVESGSPAVIARHIQALLENPGRREGLQSRAQHWLADHDWSVIAERLDGMLDAYHQEHVAEYRGAGRP